MIRMIMLIIMCLNISCFNESPTGPAKQKVYQTTGSFSYNFDGVSFSYAVPESAGSCSIIGDSTKYFISVDASNSKENRKAQMSQIVFFGYTKNSKIGTLSLGFSDSTFRLGFYDDEHNAYVGDSGTITFTTFPSQAGDTLKGIISGSIQSIIRYDPKPFTAQFSLVCEDFN